MISNWFYEYEYFYQDLRHSAVETDTTHVTPFEHLVDLDLLTDHGVTSDIAFVSTIQ